MSGDGDRGLEAWQLTPTCRFCRHASGFQGRAAAGPRPPITDH